jgi:hypothetical protein
MSASSDRAGYLGLDERECEQHAGAARRRQRRSRGVLRAESMARIAGHRVGDSTQHCGGKGTLVEGSPNVMVGGSTSSGSGRSDQPGWAPEQKGRDEAAAASADPHADTKQALAKAAKRGAGIVKKNHDHCTNKGPTTVGPA